MSSFTPERSPGKHPGLKRQMPTSVQVIAILHLVYGGLAISLGLCNGALQASGGVNNFRPPAPPPGAKVQLPPDVGPRMQRFFEDSIPFYNGIQITYLALWFVLSAVLVVAGIGLLGMRPWSRKLSLGYGFSSIAFQLANFIYLIAFVISAANDFYRQMEQEFPNMPLLAVARTTTMVTFAFQLLGLIYPIVVLVLLTRRGVVAAFAGQPPEPAEIDGEKDPGLPPGAFTR
jgi:hypothetical protein